MLNFFRTDRLYYRRFSSVTKPAYLRTVTYAALQHFMHAGKTGQRAGSSALCSTGLLRFCLTPQTLVTRLCQPCRLISQSTRQAFSTGQDADGVPPQLLQPFVRDCLILAGRAREMQPLIDVLLERHIAARQQPCLLAVLERLVRMHRAKTRIQLLLQQGL